MNVLAGESVNFNMAGFTNGNFTGLTHKVWSVVRTVCVGKGGCNDDTLTIVEAASEVSRAEEALLPLLRRISTAFVHPLFTQVYALLLTLVLSCRCFSRRFGWKGVRWRLIRIVRGMLTRRLFSKLLRGNRSLPGLLTPQRWIRSRLSSESSAPFPRTTTRLLYRRTRR